MQNVLQLWGKLVSKKLLLSESQEQTNQTIIALATLTYRLLHG
jgi:hypothetical protein